MKNMEYVSFVVVRCNSIFIYNDVDLERIYEKNFSIDILLNIYEYISRFWQKSQIMNIKFEICTPK